MTHLDAMIEIVKSALENKALCFSSPNSYTEDDITKSNKYNEQQIASLISAINKALESR